MDTVDAYLNGTLKDTLYMQQMEMFDYGSNKVCLLKISINGLKQSGCVSNETTDEVLNIITKWIMIRYYEYR